MLALILNFQNCKFNVTHGKLSVTFVCNIIQMMTTLMDPALIKRIKMKKNSEDFALTLTLDEEI